jgi:cell division protein ZapA (FtsZ GTPase activity inhibitor)
MKQKHKITVADMEMNILSDGSAEEVEAIVNKVDRRIREICLRSPRISKNEAILLCALEFCSERDTAVKDRSHTDEEFERLKEENSRLADTTARIEARLKAQKEKYEAELAAQKEKYESAAAVQKEKFEGRVQIMKEKYEARLSALKTKLDELKKGGAAAGRQLRMEIAAESAGVEDKKEEADQTSPEKTESEDAGRPAAQADDSKKETRGRGKNKVGSMFDLLTFNDV